ncbi:hypothetical protein [Prevotella aurantiaca]|uniref:hypothetical protein n=1 Tax=Prevotella aurantiaca TaxID=596085 RepID=UPI0028DC83B7|nr:hypothetical protein [Prevotella aurantiaca]
MDIIFIGILALLGMGLIVGISTWISRRNNNEPDIIVPASGDCATCSGIDESCEQTCVMVAATKGIEYFDDEELDRFKGKDSNEYTDEEADEFSEVLYTMRPEEVKGWNRSLILRGINVPNQIKDELITMIEG